MLDRARSEGRLIGLLQSGRAGEPVVCQPGAGEEAEAMTIELIDLPMPAEVEIDDARRQRDLAAESMLEVAHAALEHPGLFDSVHSPRLVAGRPGNPRLHDEIDCAADGRLEVADQSGEPGIDGGRGVARFRLHVYAPEGAVADVTSNR